MKILFVIDMQNDFIDGVLGTAEARSIVPKVIDKIKNFDGLIITTMDTHNGDYLNTLEGKYLPIEHCISGSNGWELNKDIGDVLPNGSWNIKKNTFAEHSLPHNKPFALLNRDIESIEIVGVCTDICVISNALILKSYFTEIPIKVDVSCCAGTTPENHSAAIQVMKSCQIEIMGE